MRKTKKAYEQYLNNLYSGDKAVKVGEYMYMVWQMGKIRWHARGLLEAGKYGTCLRKYDPIAFEGGFGEWKL